MNSGQEITSVFPISDTELMVLCGQPVHPTKWETTQARLTISGTPIRNVRYDEQHPNQLILKLNRSTRSLPLTIDSIEFRDFRFVTGRARRIISPRFILGIHSAMELKVPHFSSEFPFQSTLVGVHASVSCCTGCNGGMHDRNLVVVNNHIGGAWSGIWVKTGKTIEAPYPRWQRILCAGGVIAEEEGSMTLVDPGWMLVRKELESPHHAPPPLPIQTMELPLKGTMSLLTKGLDGAWVQFDNLVVEEAKQVASPKRERGMVRLPRNEVVFKDESGGSSRAFLYQPSGMKVRQGQRIQRLRGFIHAEKQGVYVLLSDKEEDIVL